MEVRLFLLADFANVDAAGKLNVIGAFNQLNPPVIPYEHPLLYLVIRVAAELGEFDQERVLNVKLFNEDGNDVWHTPDVGFKIQANEGARVVEFNPIVAIQRAKFEQPGRYEYRVYINGDSKGVAPLDVVLHPQELAE